MSEQQEILPGDGEPLEVPPAPGGDEASENVAGKAVTAEGPLKTMFDSNFLRYASYVIRDRAIPDMDDGLKPVQRRILHSLHVNDDGKFTKVANIVGHCMQFHPHGDASIADALVTLVNKGFLIEGQGNFGNVLTGDPAAASRYIECRLTGLARSELFNDDLTKFASSYDGRNKEPVSLPAKLPLLLMLGAEGIAVGVSTRILPHNFRELIEAQIAILGKKPFRILPDFPQGGIMDASQYDSGRGQVRVRAVIEKKDAARLVIRELPFGTTTDSVIASIEDAARKNKVKVRTINDFTAGSVEIEMQLQSGEDADRAIEALYAFSQCQAQISSRVVVIRNRKPVELTVDEILKHNTERLVEIVRKELTLERHKLNEELQRKTLVEIFVENRLYRNIEECATSGAAEEAVFAGLAPFRDRLVRDITAADVEMLLEIPVRRISRFDLDKNRREMQQILAGLAEAEKNLSGLVPHVIRYLRGLLKKHGEAYPRRTRIEEFSAADVREITAAELTIGYDREKGYLGHAVRGERMLQCSSYDKIVLFWKDGRYKVMQPPDKLFVDSGVIYCAVADRDRPIMIAYTEEGLTYAKKFAVGGTILNKEYRCAPKTGEIVLFADDAPPVIYVRYAEKPPQKILQQEFTTKKLQLRDPKSAGIMMTSKKIGTIAASKPADWNEALNGPRGAFMDFRG